MERKLEAGGYVYVSYSHRDEEKVTPIIQKLRAAGFRVWYDDGISSGSEWANEVAEYISNCGVFLMFLTQRSVESRMCRDELYYAESLRKKILPVMLEPCKFSTGMDLMIGRLQYLSYDAYDEETAFRYLCRMLQNSGIDQIQDRRAVHHGQISKKWFKNQLVGEAVPLNEMKVVFLGDGDVGKTYTIARLLNNGGEPLEYTDESTPGIVIKDRSYRIENQWVRVHYWDFGGQEVLHTMHRIFLTERTLYVVLLNARDETQDARARYWLHNIQSFAPNAPVVVVLNKIDQNPKAELNETELFDKYPGLRKVIKLSALRDSVEYFRKNLLDELLEQMKQAGILEHTWPAAWVRVKERLENMQDDFIDGRKYKAICRECGVDEEDDRDLLHWFNDLGVSFCCCDDYKLENYVILRPDWITNAVYILLFNACRGARNGLLPHEGICRLLNPAREERGDIRSVLPGVTYEYNEVMFVLNVVRKFQLSFKSAGDHEFVPMLCQKNSMPVAKEYAEDPDTLEFRMEFEYLPNNVLHRLMVERQNELDMDRVWLTGAVLRQEGTGLSAVVTIDERTLRILVRRGDPMHRPNTYLSMLIANVERICTVMNLQMPVKQVVYKLNDLQEVFDLALLMEMLHVGESKCYGRPWKRMLNIWDILNQAAPAASAEEQLLVDRVVSACRMLQADRNYWGAKEDIRNTFLRNALRMAGYVIHDQTFQGLSGSGKRAGEIDLDIRRFASKPWSICEALRLYDGSKGDWNDHLAKLLDNYNPAGVSHVFLVSYVDCTKERFGEIWKSYAQHIPGHSTETFTVIPHSWDRLEQYEQDTHFLRVSKCRYTCGSYTPAVYHIFVRMGE